MSNKVERVTYFFYLGIWSLAVDVNYLNHLWRFILFYVLVFKFLCCWPKKTWDGLFRDGRKKLGMI